MKIQKFNSPISKSIAHNPGSMGPRNTFINILSLSQFYFYFLSIWDLFWDKVGLNIPWVAAKLGNPRGRGEYKPQLNPHFFSSFLRFWHFSKPSKSTQKINILINVIIYCSKHNVEKKNKYGRKLIFLHILGFCPNRGGGRGESDRIPTFLKNWKNKICLRTVHKCGETHNT